MPRCWNPDLEGTLRSKNVDQIIRKKRMNDILGVSSGDFKHSFEVIVTHLGSQAPATCQDTHYPSF
jgi:hypothetical protein